MAQPVSSNTIEFPRRQRLQDRVPLDAITADARQARPGRAVLGLIGGFLFGVAWLLGKVFMVIFMSGAWGASALKMGWRQSQGKPLNVPSVEQLLDENTRLRAELSRIQV